MYTVYRHLDGDNNILYVGKSVNLLSRCMTHKHSSRWFHKVKNIEYIELESEELMSEFEVYFIKKFKNIFVERENFIYRWIFCLQCKKCV